MATSIGQYAPEFLPGESPSLTEKIDRPQSTGSLRVWHNWSDPLCIDTRLFFACGNSAPVRVEHEDGSVAWLEGTLVAPMYRDIDSLHCRSYGSIRVFFWVSCSWQSEGLFGQSFSMALSIQALRRLPGLESFSVVLYQAHRVASPDSGATL